MLIRQIAARRTMRLGVAEPALVRGLLKSLLSLASNRVSTARISPTGPPSRFSPDYPARSRKAVPNCGSVEVGLAAPALQHTSASLTLFVNESASPATSPAR